MKKSTAEEADGDGKGKDSDSASKGRGRGRGRGRGKSRGTKANKSVDEKPEAMPEKAVEEEPEAVEKEPEAMPEAVAEAPPRKSRRRTKAAEQDVPSGASEKVAAEPKVKMRKPAAADHGARKRKASSPAKPKSKAKAKAKAKVSNEEKSDADVENGSKGKHGKQPAKTFARRTRPSTVTGALKWDTIKSVFHYRLRPVLRVYSAHEDSGGFPLEYVIHWSWVVVICGCSFLLVLKFNLDIKT